MRENRFREYRLKRLSFKDPSPTIMTSKYTYYHPTEIRYLTPREAASIQSFSSDFEFHGRDGSVWEQIGNAVPPSLAKAIGKSLINCIERESSDQIYSKPNNQGKEI